MIGVLIALEAKLTVAPVKVAIVELLIENYIKSGACEHAQVLFGVIPFRPRGSLAVGRESPVRETRPFVPNPAALGVGELEPSASYLQVS